MMIDQEDVYQWGSQEFYITQEELRLLFISTIEAKNNQEIKVSESKLKKVIYAKNIVDCIVSLIMNSSTAKNIQLAAASFLKQQAELIQDNNQFQSPQTINKIINMIFTDLSVSVKQLLGCALETFIYAQAQFTGDEYIEEAISKIKQISNGPQDIKYIDSYIVLFNAFRECTNQSTFADFFFELVEPLSKIAIKCAKMIVQMTLQERLKQELYIMSKIEIIFQFLEIQIENIKEGQMSQFQNIQHYDIVQNRSLLPLFKTYLNLFCQNHSFISHVSLCPHADETNIISVQQCQNLLCKFILKIKQKVTLLITTLYHTRQCHKQLLEILFYIVISCNKITQFGIISSIMYDCLTVIQKQIKNNQDLIRSKDIYMKIIFSLFLMLVTNKCEYKLIQEMPRRFISVADQCSYSQQYPQNLKILAASSLRVFASAFEGGLKLIFDAVMSILNQTLALEISVELMERPYTKQANALYSSFAFYHLGSIQKLQTCFLIISALFLQIQDSQNMKKTVQSFFVSKYEIISRITSPIVTLRIMRAISFFPSPEYIIYLQTQMKRGEIFMIQGLLAFQKILKKNRNNELLAYISSIFVEIMNVMQIANPIMEYIMKNEYDYMIKGNINMNKLIANKVKDYFYKKQLSYNASYNFNTLTILIEKQNNKDIINDLILDLDQLSSFLLSKECLGRYDLIEQITMAYIMILQKGYQSEKIDTIADECLKKLPKQQKGYRSFRFLNLYLSKVSNSQKQSEFYNTFMITFQRLATSRVPMKDVLPYYSYLMTQILSYRSNNSFQIEQLKGLMHLLQKIQKTQKAYVISILMAYVCVQPQLTFSYLKNNIIYYFLLQKMQNLPIQETIMKKIITLGLISLLEWEQCPEIQQKIMFLLFQCIKERIKTTKKRLDDYSKVLVKPRQAPLQQISEFMMEDELNDAKNINEYAKLLKKIEKMGKNEENDNQLINIFIKFKHPFDSINEFHEFKRLYFQNKHKFVGKMGEQFQSDLRLIIQTDLVYNSKVRIIKKVQK